MADIGRAALTIGGAVLFGPWGALVGGLLGTFLFPAEQPRGPRLNELNVQHSTVGAPIQIRYGTAKGAGNIIWSGGLREIEGSSGGKGSPSPPTPSSFSVDFAVGICDGEDGSPAQPAGIRRMWFDADLVYDASDDATLTERLELGGVAPSDIADFIASVRALSAQLDFTFYNGAEDQLPDPTIEAYEGVGNVPAFRGLAYVVFNDLNLARWGNRIPNVTIETYSGTPAECGVYSPGVLSEWLGGNRDPRNSANVHYYAGPGSSFNTYYDNIQAARDDGLSGYVVNPINGWSHSLTPNYTWNCEAPSSFDYVTVYLEILVY
jgi:hypothetical protein